MTKMERNSIIVAIIMIIFGSFYIMKDVAYSNQLMAGNREATEITIKTEEKLVDIEGYFTSITNVVDWDVDFNLVNLMVDGTADGMIAIYEYFEGLMGSDAEGSNMIWGWIAQINGHGNSFQSLVRGFANEIKGLI